MGGFDDEMAHHYEAEDIDDEENTLQNRDPEERQQIEEEIEDLLETVPQLAEDYRILDQLGTGTFSSVYKAIDLKYQQMDNSPWHGNHPPESSAHYQSIPLTSRAYVAIKRIYVTSSPERIRNEISILEDCRGCRHVSQLITAFRERDQVVVVMPYQRNVDFREYYLDLTFPLIKDYFRCLFRALRDVHARHIVHRDVKPANFLFDPKTGVGTLCDFGLASRIDYYAFTGQCNHTSPTSTNPQPRIKIPDELNVELIQTMQRDARKRSQWPADRVGSLTHDPRPHSKANRAGTRGFRAPEVLLKCNEQTGAIDIWAAGIILLFFLCGRFPMFQSADDVEALLEIATIIGRKEMEHRVIITNIPSLQTQGVTWSDFCRRPNPDISTSSPPALDLMLDLASRLLDPDCTRRYSARDALSHPWLLEGQANDDEYFPHPFGEGSCGHLHFRDIVTDEPCAIVNGCTVKLLAGEGIAIGNLPCNVHKTVNW
ncbi:kinase-like protein [Sistotremastrum suecicum HHB10207 ss-3]|uniref:non-specific serine/threonine protein kinase n=1 Tax=Sistotremastrum suecicum HHB10207 ss-3 TaxID=1314776 RepID=A0A166BS37_9AGAM|nr:kinase-like protein [Sistotremastrum suecicum HHB10207 ss-3]